MTADGESSVRYVAHLSGVLRGAGEWGEALTFAERAVRLANDACLARPGDEELFRTLDAQFQSLIETLQGLIAAEPSPSSGRFLALADALRQRFIVQEKLNLLNVLRVLDTGVAETAPNTPPDVLAQRAVTLGELGRTQEAVEALERLRAADPHNPLIAEWLLRLQGPPPSESSD
jgi:tetratricopeptide (TPR) repeat protein